MLWGTPQCLGWYSYFYKIYRHKLYTLVAASVPWLLIFHVRDIGLAGQHHHSPALSFIRWSYCPIMGIISSTTIHRSWLVGLWLNLLLCTVRTKTNSYTPFSTNVQSPNTRNTKLSPHHNQCNSRFIKMSNALNYEQTYMKGY